jgi:hypothetical protein
MVAAANQGKCHGAGIGEVTGDIEPVFKEPDGAGGNAERLALAPKTHRQDDREHQLAERATIWLESSAKQSNHWMAGFVEEQIGVVQQEDESRFGAEKKKQEHGHDQPKTSQLRLCYRFPFSLCHGQLGSRNPANSAIPTPRKGEFEWLRRRKTATSYFDTGNCEIAFMY